MQKKKEKENGKAPQGKAPQKRDLAKELMVWAFQIIVVLACAVVVAILFFKSVTVQESSMEPTLTAGERFFVNQMVYKFGKPKRGDIIAFRTSSEPDASIHVKRVVGLPDETVQIENGQILINGETYKERKDFPNINDPGLAEEEIHLDSGEYFVLGDNRNNSGDSRYGDVGNIQKKNIQGKLWFVAWPINKIGFLNE